MKTFLATFAAILCAAGVIWGIHSHQQSDQRTNQAETDLARRAFAATCNTFRFDGNIKDDMLETMSKGLDGALDYMMLLLRRGALSRAETGAGVLVFVEGCRKITAENRKRFPAKKEWADGIDAKIAELEKLQATAIP